MNDIVKYTNVHINAQMSIVYVYSKLTYITQQKQHYETLTRIWSVSRRRRGTYHGQ